jgi:hypothetical protein
MGWQRCEVHGRKVPGREGRKFEGEERRAKNGEVKEVDMTEEIEMKEEVLARGLKGLGHIAIGIETLSHKWWNVHASLS